MVVDRTGLVGPLDFTLRWRPDDALDVNAEYPSLFTAIEEQLGLRLRPARAAANVTVIDSAARPTKSARTRAAHTAAGARIAGVPRRPKVPLQLDLTSLAVMGLVPRRSSMRATTSSAVLAGGSDGGP